MEVFQHCPGCQIEFVAEVKKIFGTAVSIYQKCTGCGVERLWNSQPNVRHTPVGNLMLSASLLFSGSSISKTLLFLHHLGIPTILYQTYLNHQSFYLHPAIEPLCIEEQTSVKEKIKAAAGKFIAAGDGRADSPGHSARHGRYTVLDTNLSKLVDTEW